MPKKQANQSLDEQLPTGTLALSVRQPWAELILRGDKKSEQRGQPTNIRGRIYIYAGLKHYDRDEEADWADEFNLDIDGLPRGVIVGSVELADCRRGDAGEGFDWVLKNPIRAKDLIKPTRRPNPVWFRPW